MSFKTNNDPDQDQDQATTTLSHVGTTMFQFATTTTDHGRDHGSTLMEDVQHQPFENGHDEFPDHSSNSESLKRMREEQPQEEEKEEKDDETSSSSSLALATTHQDEAATLQALVVTISFLSIIPTDTLFLIMEFVDCVGLSRLISLSSSLHRVVNIFLERLSNQVSFAIPASGQCLQNTMGLLQMLSKRGNGYNMARTVSLVLAEGVHVVWEVGGMLRVPHVNVSIGIKEQEKGKEKEKVDIIGGLEVGNGGCLCLTGVTVKDSSGQNGLRAYGAGTKMVLKNVKVEKCQNEGVNVDDGANLNATGCHFHQNGVHGVWVHGSTTTARLTNCTSHHNKSNGVLADSGAVVDLMGEETSVHDNEGFGLFARWSGAINVYQPCVLNDMSHGNKGQRLSGRGGRQNIRMVAGGRVQQKDSKK